MLGRKTERKEEGSRKKYRPTSRQEDPTILKGKKIQTNKHTMDKMLKETNVNFRNKDETVKTN